MSDSGPPPLESDEVGSPLLTRRRLLASGVTGAAAAYVLATPPWLRAGVLKELASGTVTFGSNYSDPTPHRALVTTLDKFTKQTGVSIKRNDVDHNTFQEQINSYLQGTPDDVFTWFAGYRMQFFAQKGLLTPIDDVWAKLKPQFSSAFAQASTGLDGKKYFVPIYNYPWAVFYRRSLFKAKGYKVPRTWDQFITLAKKMKADGNPMSFTDKDGWPAMGTFDYINMRTNGYDFHVRLMAGKESWDSPRVKSVFNTWRQLLPYYEPGFLGRTWQEGGTSLANKKTGMYVLGSFVAIQFTDPKAAKDLDFFAFPAINPRWGQDSVEAPIDGFLLSRNPKNEDGAKALLTFLGSKAAADTWLGVDHSIVGANRLTSQANYTYLQKKSAKLISTAKHISQYMDRDTRPDFASTVMIPALQQFLNHPNDVNGLVKSIEKQKKSIFAA